VANIVVTDITHEYAVLVDGDNTKLTTATSGPVRLLTRLGSTSSNATGLVFVGQFEPDTPPPPPPNGMLDSKCLIGYSYFHIDEWIDDENCDTGALAAGTYLFSSAISGTIYLHDWDAFSSAGQLWASSQRFFISLQPSNLLLHVFSGTHVSSPRITILQSGAEFTHLCSGSGLPSLSTSQLERNGGTTLQSAGQLLSWAGSTTFTVRMTLHSAGTAAHFSGVPALTLLHSGMEG
jgi:hypothetical protein